MKHAWKSLQIIMENHTFEITLFRKVLKKHLLSITPFVESQMNCKSSTTLLVLKIRFTSFVRFSSKFFDLIQCLLCLKEQFYI